MPAEKRDASCNLWEGSGEAGDWDDCGLSRLRDDVGELSTDEPLNRPVSNLTLRCPSPMFLFSSVGESRSQRSGMSRSDSQRFSFWQYMEAASGSRATKSSSFPSSSNSPAYTNHKSTNISKYNCLHIHLACNERENAIYGYGQLYHQKLGQ